MKTEYVIPTMSELASIGKDNGPRGAEGTSEPIWLFQLRETWIPEPLRIDEEELSQYEWEMLESGEYEFECWNTKMVFLSREEAESHGESRSYEYGEKNVDWRVYCISLWQTSDTKHILSAIDTKNLERNR